MKKKIEKVDNNSMASMTCLPICHSLPSFHFRKDMQTGIYNIWV